jgi:hypothetical protein
VNARALREMEADVGRAGSLSLRYGFFYGPGAWYHRDGASARGIAEGRIPIVGDDRGRWSLLHVACKDRHDLQSEPLASSGTRTGGTSIELRNGIRNKGRTHQRKENGNGGR